MSLLASLSLAWAGTCDPLVAKLSDTPREELTALYAEVVACSPKVGQKAFKDFVRKSGDVETLVDLSLKAIELEQYQPTWDMLEQLTDYRAREEVAHRVGALCQDQVGVLPFLQGGYIAANDRAFGMWAEAFETCPSDALDEWLLARISDPPTRTYDDKYTALLDGLIAKQGDEALPALERAAVAASQRGGPFTTVLEKMRESVQPRDISKSMTDADQKRLADAYLRVGTGGVRPEQAANVADRLYQQGYREQAASLLKVVYGDRVQSDGTLRYGVVSVEHCGGEAYVHVASVFEPSRRWNIQPDVDPLARSFKQRLKCDTDGPWPVTVTRSPVATEADVEGHGAEVAKQWADKGLIVRIREEKPLTMN